MSLNGTLLVLFYFHPHAQNIPKFTVVVVCLLYCLGTMDSVASRLVAVGSNAFQQEETKVSALFSNFPAPGSFLYLSSTDPTRFRHFMVQILLRNKKRQNLMKLSTAIVWLVALHRFVAIVLFSSF